VHPASSEAARMAVAERFMVTRQLLSGGLPVRRIIASKRLPPPLYRTVGRPLPGSKYVAQRYDRPTGMRLAQG
jgi:hypothetical protein